MRATALLLLAGCSATFQARVPDGWTIAQDPRCTTDKGTVFLDVIGAIAVGGLGIAMLGRANQDTPQDPPSSWWAIGGVATAAAGLAYAFSADAGNDWADECARALEQRKWQPPITNKLAPMPRPRGFFCTTSTVLNSCARERVDCERVRAAVLAVAPDISACAMQETAWCSSDERCVSTREACEAQPGATCEERK